MNATPPWTKEQLKKAEKAIQEIESGTVQVRDD